MNARVCDLDKKYGDTRDDYQHPHDGDPQAAFGIRGFLVDPQMTISEIVTEWSRKLLAKEIPFKLSERIVKYT